MESLEDGWQTKMPASLAAAGRLPRAQQEVFERQTLNEWANLEGSWSGVAKHITPKSPEAKTIHARIKLTHDAHLLGRGSYGHVEKVTYSHRNRPITLARKCVRATRHLSIHMLREEANVTERLDHEHIIKLVGTYSVRPSELYLLLWPVAVCNLEDLLWDLDYSRLARDNGETREDIVDRLQRLELAESGTAGRYLQQIMGCITDAVAYCHNAAIRHLDLKPANILVTPGGIYLADFGISQDVQDRDCTMTLGGLGTAKWGAPEVRNIDAGDVWSMRRADVHGLGLVLLAIATVLYGGDLSGLEKILVDRDDNARPERLRQFHTKLQLDALATQRWANHDAHTFGPKHIVELTARMLSPQPQDRPTILDIVGELVEFGGIDQIYHGSCCRKPTRWLTSRLDTKYKLLADANDRLKAENTRILKRLEELERRDETYQMRLENERKQHTKNLSNLQRQLEAEQAECTKLKAQLAGPPLPNGNHGRRRGLSGSKPADRIINGGLNVSSTQPITHRPKQASTVQRTQAPRPALENNPRMLPQPHLLASTSNSKSQPNFAPPAARVSSAPTPPSRTSTSRLPLAVNPVTPIRSRSGTPNLSRDLSLTDSTQLSLASSTFSHLSGMSRETEQSAAPSPAAGRDIDSFTVRFGDNSPLLLPSEWSDGLARATNGAKSPSIGLGISTVNGRRGSNPAEPDAASVVSSRCPNATSIGGSVVSSPSLKRVEPNIPRSPPAKLYKEKSWADVARRPTDVKILR